MSVNARVAFVHGDVLRQPFAQAEAIRVGTSDWFDWLETHTSFAFANDEGHFTARKEYLRRSRSNAYWRAYRERDGKLRSMYLGRSEDLSLDRLHMAAHALAPGREASSTGDWDHAASNVRQEALVRMKSSLPRVPQAWMPRPRLLERLRDERPSLTLVIAPPGYGKTTLVVDWIITDQRKAAWVSLDARDNDPTRFWSAVAASLDAQWPGVGRRTLALLRLVQPMSVAAILPALLHDMATHLVEGHDGNAALLVLDDYHVITNKAVHDSVSFFLEHLPSPCRLAILSATPPPLLVGRHRLIGQWIDVRVANLAFTQDEAAAYLRGMLNLRLDDESVATLIERTEGWAAALQLAGIALHDEPDASQLVVALQGSRYRVFDTLVERVIARQVKSVQRWLMSTAISDFLCAELCSAVMDAHEQMLPHRMHMLPFLIPLDDEGSWYRYAPWFAEALLCRLRATHSNLESDLRREASIWFERAGLLALAVDQALDGLDGERAAALVERVVHTSWERGETTLVWRWLEALPERAVMSRPQLGVMRALCLLQAHRLPETIASLDALERALSGEQRHEQGERLHTLSSAAIRARVQVLRAHAASLAMDVERGRTLARLALADLSPNDHLWHAAGSFLLGQTSHGIDDLIEAERAYASTAASARRAHAHGMAMASLGLQAEVLIARGRLTEAEMVCQEARNLAMELGVEMMPSYSDVALATIYYERNELDRAERLMLREVEHLANIGLAGLRLRALLVWSQLRLARGDADSAVQALNLLEASFESQIDPHPRVIAAWRAWVFATLASDPTCEHDQAARHRADAIRWANELEMREQSAFEALTDIASRQVVTMPVRARLLRGDAQGALSLLRVLAPRAEAIGAHHVLVELLMLEALALDQLDERPAALKTLTTALVLGEPEGYVRSFVNEGQPIARLLKQLLAGRERGLARVKAYGRELLEVFGETPNVRRVGIRRQ